MTNTVNCSCNGCNNKGRFEFGTYLYGYFSERHGFICVPCMSRLKGHLETVYHADGVVLDSDITGFIMRGNQEKEVKVVDELLSQFR